MTDAPAKFPTKQITILAISRFAEPVAYTSVYPYIPELISSFNVPTDRIGVYSGWLSATFSLSQCTTGVIWGRASDKLGRKPMILLALVCIMISSVLFGFSSSLIMAFVARSIQGASSGNVGIIRTAVAEMVPQKELQPRAFSVMPLVWNIGSIFGPILGGFLSNPQRRGWFTGSTLLKEYPFALPNLTISVLFIVGIFSGLFFLRETHVDLKYRRDYGLTVGSLLTSSCSKRGRRRSSSWSSVDDHNGEADPFLDEEDASPLTTQKVWKSPHPVSRNQPARTKKSASVAWSEIFSRQSSINLAVYTGLAMHSIAFDQLLPVFMHHPRQSITDPVVHLPLKFAGGFGLDSGQIGVLFTVYGIFGMLVQFLCFPPLARKFGVLNCLKACALTFPLVYIAMPFTSLLSTSQRQRGFCLALMLVKCVAGIFAFPCSTILLTNSATSLNVLGTLNGVSTSISAAGRAAGPALVGWVFTVGVDLGYGVLPWWTLCVVATIAAVPIWWLVEMEGFSSTKKAEIDGSAHENSGIQLNEDGIEDENERLTRIDDEDEDEATVLRNTSTGLGVAEVDDVVNRNIEYIPEPSTTSSPEISDGVDDDMSMGKITSAAQREGEDRDTNASSNDQK